jgi:hypothetical protein
MIGFPVAGKGTVWVWNEPFGDRDTVFDMQRGTAALPLNGEAAEHGHFGHLDLEATHRRIAAPAWLLVALCRQSAAVFP